MAAAIHQPRADNVPSGLSLYPHTMALTEFDFKDNPYTPLTPPVMQNHRPTSTVALNSSNPPWNGASNSGDTRGRGNPQTIMSVASGRDREERMRNDTGVNERTERLYNPHPSQPKHDSVVSYAVPAGARRVLERYSLDDGSQRASSGASADTRLPAHDSSGPVQDLSQQRQISQSPTGRNDPRDQSSPFVPSTSRRLPSSGVAMGAGPSNNATSSPVAASQALNPSLGIPISPKPRAYAQHPTYITPPSAPNPVNPIFSPAPPVSPEEVCVECAMRDQDMADVDVSSPGVWERESDALYEDLLQREYEDTVTGVLTLDPSRPKAKGGRLTEQNLKIWVSLNPREPASRQQTLETYIRSQRKLLEAEAVAHARAMQEAKQLDNRMRDTYSQLRRSAYDIGSAATVNDDSGGVRIKPPNPSTSPIHARSQSREVTLLENGMIVEHVDMRKEEREARDRRRKEEKRARKASRSSGMDVTSVYSESLVPHVDNLGLKPSSRYSQASSARPTSVLTVPVDRPNIPRAYSQASFSDVHSISSASPRRSRFFGLKNLSASWRSQDSLAQSGMSGSMVNMHVALQRESHTYPLTQSPVDMGGPVSRRSQLWPPADPDTELQSQEKPKKRKTGLAKIWRIVTGSSKTYPPANGGDELPSYERNEDDLPLAPPPPLSYLVERGPGDLAVARHGSTTSLHSTTSPKNVLSSPGTAPSTVLPSPISSRRSVADRDIVIEGRIQNGQYEDYGQSEVLADEGSKLMSPRNVISDVDMRQLKLQDDPNNASNTTNSYPASVISREKSLPPLPGEIQGPPDMAQTDTRPRALSTYDPRQIFASTETQEFLPPLAPFRNSESRRQSFGGMASPPNVAVQMVQTVPNRRGTYNQQDSVGTHNEFGSSRRSLGRLEYVQEHVPVQRTSTPTAKRKSKFGFALLLGRKHEKSARESGPHEFPTLSRSGPDRRDDVMLESVTNGHATSTSRHSALSGLGPGPRMSTTSRKAIGDLVCQDAEFVAYRYPSNDQRLDILR